MPYIKISDPNIIDLAAWHQVINVINQHSDSLTAITNNFGAQGSGTTSWNGANDIHHQYDSGSQKIIFGRTKISNDLTSASTGNHMLYLTIQLEDAESGTAAFGALPIITASASFGSGDPTPDSSGGRENVICTISAIKDDSFIIRVVNARSTKTNPVPLFTADTQYFYINWIAIGPK